MTNFLEKANLFNEFFTQQCNTIENGSTLPNDLVFETKERISSSDISNDKITKIIKSLDPNKALGHYEISIRMLKLCTLSISKPLLLLFEYSLKKRMFSKPMEESKYCANSQRGNKHLIQNYRPVSLLPRCWKIFKKLNFNSLFEYLEKNNLLNPHQSRFHPSEFMCSPTFINYN